KLVRIPLSNPGPATSGELRRNAEPEVLAEAPTSLKKPGAYHLRFANVDRRLTLWVDGSLPFGDGKPYDAPKEPKTGTPILGPPQKNDREPASIGVRGDHVRVSNLKLWRDTYYPYYPPRPHDAPGPDIPNSNRGEAALEKPSQPPPAMTMYVQPGH